jgi:seryl-tRNA synthetase
MWTNPKLIAALALLAGVLGLACWALWERAGRKSVEVKLEACQSQVRETNRATQALGRATEEAQKEAARLKTQRAPKEKELLGEISDLRKRLETETPAAAGCTRALQEWREGK